MSKPHLSANSITKYLQCGKKWWFKYVMGLSEQYGADATLGRAWHSGALEANYKQKIVTHTDLPADEMEDRFMEAWRGEIADETPVYDKDKDQTQESMEKLGRQITAEHHKAIAPKVKPALIEHKFVVSLGENHPYDLMGYLDLVEEDGTIVDSKSWSPSRASGVKNAPEKDVQMSCYAFARRQETGKPEGGLRYDVIVKNKTPKALQIVTSRSVRQLEAFADLVGDVTRGIKAGSFPARTDGWWCAKKWCGYHTRCKHGSGSM